MALPALPILLAALGPGPAQAAEPEWRLMARHGECAPLAVLERKLPGAASLRTPAQLAELLKRQGLAFTQKEMPAQGQERGVAFEVPAKELHILLVTAGLCEPAGTSTR
ncbi:hypothetical protein [Inhella proteolytica]|uniref:Uncharacterized protein n=1 Tax=Inhella proteolytica TaxID=2795029 RepID=A0A931IZV1_9BURK|nr:hypothetical protein [Inhella proteolytica]MBH9576864.1 hypothetical protein [Inhella proteolytica]